MGKGMGIRGGATAEEEEELRKELRDKKGSKEILG